MKRVASLDVLRGITVALMLLVNNPGTWAALYPPLQHAPWNGMTPTDFVFPSFLYVMGVSMYFSLRKTGFRLGWKVLRRCLLIIGIGILCNWISYWVYNHTLITDHLRWTGVLQRIGLSFGLTALLVCLVDHKWLGWIAALLLAAYTALLLLGNGYVDGPENILLRIDSAVLGPRHLYGRGECVDPEGLASTLPCVAHALIGFMTGKLLAQKEFRRMDVWGVLLLVGGLLLQWWLPLNKKIWSPSFVLVSCGLGTLLLSVLHYLIDERSLWRHTGFFRAFGTNAIYCFLASDVLAWVCVFVPARNWFLGALGTTPFTSLLFALCCVLTVYLMVLPLYRRRIFLRL